MKDLRSYGQSSSNSNNNNSTEHIREEMERKVTPQEISAAEELTKRALAAYNGKSDMFLLAQIVKQAEISKKEGKLTNDELEEFYVQFSALLPEAHKRKLRQVIDKLKKL